MNINKKKFLNKLFKIFVLYFIFTLFYINITYASITDIIFGVPKAIINFISGVLNTIVALQEKLLNVSLQDLVITLVAGFISVIFGIVEFILEIFFIIFHFIIFTFNKLLGLVADFIANLQPIGNTGPAKIMWSAFRDLSYIVFAFSALAAAYEFIFGNSGSAQRLIIHIIIVGLLINFSYSIVKEFYNIINQIEIGLSGGQAKKVGSIIVASLWSEDPFDLIDSIAKKIEEEIQIDEESASGVLEKIVLTIFKSWMILIAKIIGWVFIIAFDFLTMQILFILIGLLISRYVIVIILAGISALAFVSAILPSFGNKGISRIFSSLRIFDIWLENLVKWLLLVPTFVILLLFGNLVKNEVLSNMADPSSLLGEDINFLAVLFQFIITFLIFIAWTIISIKLAVELGGRGASFSKNTSDFLSIFIGGLLLKSGVAIAGIGVNRGIEKASGKLIEKVDTQSKIGSFIAKPALSLYQRSRRRQQELNERKNQLFNTKLEILSNKLNYANKNNIPELNNVILDLNKILAQSQNNPELIKKIRETLEKLNPENKEKIFQPEIFKNLLSNLSNFNKDVKEVISDAIIKNNAEKIINNYEILESIFDSGILEARKSLLEGLDNLNEEQIIKSLSKINKDNLDNISTNTKFQSLKNKLNQKTQGLIESIINAKLGNITSLSATLEALNEKAGELSDEISTIAENLGLRLNTLENAYKDAIMNDPDKQILIGAANAQRIGRTNLKFLSKLLSNTPHSELGIDQTKRKAFRAYNQITSQNLQNSHD